MRAAILVLFILVGCSEGTSEKSETPPAAEENEEKTAVGYAREIVGRWSLDGKCDADLLTIQPDGTWQSSVEAGRWHVERNNLVITRVSSASNEALPEERRLGLITSLTGDQMTLSYNGEAETWSRCV